MTSRLLLPNKYKVVGWFLLIPSAIVGVILSFTGFDAFPIKAKMFAILNDELFGKTKLFSFIEVSITNTIIGVLFIIGALFVGFSKEKTEDEFITNLRLSSLLWAVWVNHVLLLLAVLFIYGTPFFTVMVYNMFTILLIFIGRFNYILYRNTKTVTDEK